MNADLAAFKKVKSTPHMTVLRHPAGHEITIAHAGLGEDLRKQLESMPAHLAEGTEPDAPAATEEEEEETPSPQPTQVPTPVGASPATAVPAPAPGASPTMPPSALDQYTAQQEAALGDIAQAKKDEFRASANAYLGEQEALQAQQEKQDAFEKEWQQDQTHLIKNIQDGHIDPNRIWHTPDVGPKIGAAIGVLLGGLGAGMTGKENVALGVIQKSIDRDIEAQRQDMSQAHTLLGANMQRYRDERSAEAATRIQLLTATQAKIAQAASQSGSQQAMAQAKLQAGQLEMQKLQLKQQLFLNMSQAQMVGAAGGTGGGLPSAQVPYQTKLDPRYVEHNGQAYLASDKEDASDIKNFKTVYDPIVSNLKRLDDLGPTALIKGTKESIEANALRARLASQILSTGKSARMSPEAIKEAKEQFDNPTSFAEVLHKGAASSVLKQSLDSELEAKLKKLPGYRGREAFGFEAGNAAQAKR